MAINKKLIHFKSKENFDNEVANGNILDTSICFIQDSKEISTHNTIYKTVSWSTIDENTVVNSNTDLYEILNLDYDSATNSDNKIVTEKTVVSLLNTTY